jgi:hypothetical protein
MKRSVVIIVGITLVLLGYLTFTTVDSKTPVAAAAAKTKTYTGTVYVAGWAGISQSRGHDRTEQCERTHKDQQSDRIVIGDKTTHPRTMRVSTRMIPIRCSVNLRTGHETDR